MWLERLLWCYPSNRSISDKLRARVCQRGMRETEDTDDNHSVINQCSQPWTPIYFKKSNQLITFWTPANPHTVQFHVTTQPNLGQTNDLLCINPLVPLIVAKISLPKDSEPYWSNPPFSIFLTFGHSGDHSWAPECPNVKKLKMVS